jgi:hypothetical protein
MYWINACPLVQDRRQEAQKKRSIKMHGWIMDSLNLSTEAAFKAAACALTKA